MSALLRCLLLAGLTTVVGCTSSDGQSGTGNGGSAGAAGVTGAGGSNGSGIGGGNGAGGATTGAGGATGNGGGTGAGGSAGTGGNPDAGGTTGMGGAAGATGAGGTAGSAGSAGTGGSTGTGGGAGGGDAGGGPVGGNVVRSVTSFDDGWLFNLGDPTGADQPAFADTTWRSLSVPHDWSIEGQFDQAATTLGNGGYLPTGVGWYRKHFTLPASMSGRRIFVEFDGVMAHSDVFINGTRLGNRPFGYVSFRYEITTQATFGGAGNVIAVRADDSAQPASRWYAGAGIYRHVRLIASNPIHVGQWATFVTTPTVSATAATVHVTTTVVNQGAAAATGVTVQANVSDPSGTKLAPVTSAAQNIAVGASANFAIDVPVANPRLWAPGAPNMYQLVTNVISAGATVDDDVTSFGIRTIVFDPTTGFSINGVNTKLKGVGMHHDMSGLGSAVPMRAWQRRLAQIKSIGANALRTSHNPFAPEVLDLCDRMGILVLDEFFDAWTLHKLAADYGGADFNMWGVTDMTDTIKRDRNHPSVVLYSIGNEIRDSLASRMTTATNLVGVAHTTDPSRLVTAALFRPMDSLDFPGAMLNILDVFGANYRTAEVISAIGMSPPHAGLVTEGVSTSTADWGLVTSTPALTGDFIWTSHDYLGEAAGLFPTIGSSTGMMDRVGTLKPIAYNFATVWGASPARPATGTTATKVVLTADHPTVLTDPNDVSFVKATIADANGNVVTSASTAVVTFSITGPGTIVAVDSGSVMAESFRGNARTAFQGLAFAIVKATGAGAITVTASSPGLTGSSATVQASAGTFVPCSGTCD
jgi:beta-galactosidase